MTNCRIGKVKYKNPKIKALPSNTRYYCHNAVEVLSKHIDHNTKAVGFFILERDGNVKAGFSYDQGTALGEMVGASDVLKSDIYDHWAEDDGHDGAA